VDRITCEEEEEEQSSSTNSFSIILLTMLLVVSIRSFFFQIQASWRLKHQQMLRTQLLILSDFLYIDDASSNNSRIL